MLPVKKVSGDVFTDILFMPEDERMENASFCAIRTTVADLTEFPEENILKLCRDICIVNNELPIGCYGVSTTEGSLPLKALVFSVTVPIAAGISGDLMTDTIEDALTLAAATIEETISGLNI